MKVKCILSMLLYYVVEICFACCPCYWFSILNVKPPFSVKPNQNEQASKSQMTTWPRLQQSKSATSIIHNWNNCTCAAQVYAQHSTHSKCYVARKWGGCTPLSGSHWALSYCALLSQLWQKQSERSERLHTPFFGSSFKPQLPHLPVLAFSFFSNPAWPYLNALFLTTYISTCYITFSHIVKS